MKPEQNARPHSVLNLQSAALAVSVFLHPFLLGPLTVLLLTDTGSSAVVAVTIAIPLLILTIRNVRRGVWSNHDVSVRTQRRGLYWSAIALTALAAVWLGYRGAAPGLVRGVAAAAVMFAIAMLVNRWLKISLHMLVAAFSAVAIADSHPGWIPFLALSVVALAWSRLYLRRHSWVEVLAGVILGTAVGTYVALT